MGERGRHGSGESGEGRLPAERRGRSSASLSSPRFALSHAHAHALTHTHTHAHTSISLQAAPEEGVPSHPPPLGGGDFLATSTPAPPSATGTLTQATGLAVKAALARLASKRLPETGSAVEELRVRLANSLKRHFHAKRADGLLSGRATRVLDTACDAVSPKRGFPAIRETRRGWVCFPLARSTRFDAAATRG